MDIHELENYNLDDAVKFHDRLNPRIWGRDEKMLPQVRRALLAIADDFREHLGVNGFEIQDITVSGSNAAYTYTPHSDVDLHLVVEIPELNSEVYRELFNAKKYQYNDEHDIRIGSYDVELYVQDAEQPHHSQGIYSIQDDRWISVPRRQRAQIDDDEVRAKYEDLGHRIESLLATGDEADITRMIERLKTMRAAGLAEKGEFGAENLAFKLLRRQGLIQQLYDRRHDLRDAEMSLQERRKRKRKSQGRTRYAYGGYWYPGYGYYGDGSDAGDGGGGDGGGGESRVQESADHSDVIDRFVDFAAAALALESRPRIRLRRDPAWSERQGTFGMYDKDSDTIMVSTANRHVMDVLRTLAHELCHHRQNELVGLPADAGETGSEYEDSANAMAGRIMRDFREQHSDLFDAAALSEASGYIPSETQRDDPRFKMALTKDVTPDSIKDNATRLGSRIARDGRPPLLMKKLNNLLESIKQEQDQGSSWGILGEEDLLEVKMSPAEFQKFLKSPAAEGIRAGFEAEMIFRNTQGDVGGGGESDLDWDADEGATDIDDIINFFTSGQEPISPRQARRLQEELQEQFSDWVREQFANDYFDQDRFMSWAEDNVWPDNEDHYREDARANLDDDATDEDIEREAVSLFRDDVERDWDRSGAWYEMASEELFDEYAGDADQYEWLYSAGLSMMSDVANEYNLDWPYYRESNYGDGERDWQEIADGLGRATGMPVRVSGSYKGAARREGQYIIEPDSSLEDGRDDPDDFGLEIVSPPLPLPEALEQLRRVIDWANGPGDAYTNEKTGLHMGVSLPYKGGDVDPIKLILFMGDKDLLEKFERLGNTYTESAYQRLESKIRSMRNAGPKQIAGIMDLMKNNLIELAERELKQGVLGNKYVSVNPHDGYIEFRGPGNDYLAKEDEIDGVLENTMLRLAYAMSIAGDNAAYRQEYAKKLYKVLTKDDPANPFMQLFADYSAGTLTGEQLKRQWADTVLQAERKDVEDMPWSVPGEYEVYDKDSGTPGDRDSFTVIDTFQSNSDENAMVIAQEKWSGRGVNFGVRARVAEPEEQKPKSRRAELAKRVTRSTRDVGEQLWRVNHHSSVRWVTARSQAEAVNQAIQQDRAFNSAETRARIATDLEKVQWNLDQERQRERDAGRDAAEIRARLGVPVPAGGGSKTYEVTWGEVEGDTMRTDSVKIQARSDQHAMQMIRDAVQARGAQVRYIRAEEFVPDYPEVAAPSQQAQGEFTGRWIIKDARGRVLQILSGIGNNQMDANRAAVAWLRRNYPNMVGQGVEVVPEMQ